MAPGQQHKLEDFTEMKENESSPRQTMLGGDTEKYVEKYLGSATNEIINQVSMGIDVSLPAQCTFQADITRKHPSCDQARRHWRHTETNK